MRIARAKIRDGLQVTGLCAGGLEQGSTPRLWHGFRRRDCQLHNKGQSMPLVRLTVC